MGATLYKMTQRAPRVLAGRLRAVQEARIRHMRNRVADERCLAGRGDLALRAETSGRRDTSRGPISAKYSVRSTARQRSTGARAARRVDEVRVLAGRMAVDLVRSRRRLLCLKTGTVRILSVESG
jgi:hypothetical protein